MKTTTTLLIVLLLMSCGKNDVGINRSSSVDEVGIGLLNNELSFNEESTVEIVKTENANWYISHAISRIGMYYEQKHNNESSEKTFIIGDWFAIKKIDSNTLEIKVDENNIDFMRELEITLSNGTSVETIQVTQTNKNNQESPWDSTINPEKPILPDKWFITENLEYTTCEEKELNVANKPEDTSSKKQISCKASETTLFFDHKLLVNCCFKNLDIKYAIENNSVFININSSEHDCNCICPIIANYEIPGLISNEKYEFFYLLNGFEYARFELIFDQTKLNEYFEIQLK